MGEKFTGKKVLKFLVVLLISTSITFLIAAPYYFFPRELRFVRNFLASFESASINWRFSMKVWLSGENSAQNTKQNTASKGAYSNFAIVAVDDTAIDYFGGSFPFDRKVWANTLDEFNKRPIENMPKMVFFDIVFADPSQKPDSDKALSNAFRNYKAFLGEDIMPDAIRDINLKGDESEIIAARKRALLSSALEYNSPRIQALKKFELKPDQKYKKLRPFATVAPLMVGLADSLSFVGTANIEREETTYRLIPLIVSVYYKIDNELTNIYYPSVILAMTVKLLGSDISNIVLENGYVKIKNAHYQGKIQDFLIPVNDRCQLAINYKSTPASGFIRTLSLKGITKAKLPKDAVLFIGMYSKQGSHDIKASPLGEMYGVEHNAYALGTILNRDYILSVPDWVNVLYLFLLAAAIGLLISRGTQFTGIAGLTAIVFPLVAGLILFMFNKQIITFLPLLTGVMVLAGVQIFILLTEEKEKKFIKATFSSYLNPKLVDILIQNPERIQLGGQDKEVTVFFSAIKGLDNIAESVQAKELIQYLNSYFSKMADIIMDSSGTLDKYIGDAVMAFWGAPIDIPDHALKACQASVKMLEAVRQFNEEQEKAGYKSIQINIGLNTGNIIVGNVGSEQQKNYTAIGDAVNLASRLKGLNKYFHTNIVISEYTYELVKDSIIARELDLTKVKGKTKPVRIYELLDIK